MMGAEPPRLKSGDTTPGELVRTLEALARGHDAERLARVAEQLGARMALGPSTPRWVRNVSGTKLGLTALALGIGAGLLGYVLNVPRFSAREIPATRNPIGTAVQEPIPAASHVVPQAEDRPTRAFDRAIALPFPRARPPHREGGARSSTGSRAAAAPARPAIALESGRVTAPEGDPASTSAPTPVSTSGTVQALSRPALEREAAPRPASPVATPAPSELALLLQAREVSEQTPEQALRLLNEHAKRFPNGMLAPERELLVIEVLRRLGRDAEAATRLRRFETKYPRSLHLRRLERDAASLKDH